MISRAAFCSAQAARMLAARTGPMPSTSRSRSGLVSMMSKTFSPNVRTSFFGVDRPYAADHSRREVSLDAVGRRRRRGAEEARFELLAMGAVIDPLAR